jgi:hypothetical protein
VGHIGVPSAGCIRYCAEQLRGWAEEAGCPSDSASNLTKLSIFKSFKVKGIKVLGNNYLII